MKLEKKKFIVLVGMPGSGKSTWFESYKLDHSDAVRCSSDKYIEEAAKNSGKTYKEVFLSTISEASKKYNSDRREYIQKKYDNIVIDRTNLVVPSRASAISGIDKNQYHLMAIVLDVPFDVIKDRNEQRKSIGRDIPLNILEEMWQSKQINVDADFKAFDEVIRYEKIISEV